MKRLLIVATYPLTIQTFLLPYARYFRSRGWRVDALASGDMSALASSFDRTFTITWSKALVHLKTWFYAPRRIRALVAAQGYDLVHVHTPVAAFAARLALKSLRRSHNLRVIYTAHGFHFYDNGSWLRNAPYVLAEKLAAPWTDYLIVMNKEDDTAARRHRLAPDRSLRVMPGIGLDLDVYSRPVSANEVTAARHVVGLSATDEYLLCVAEFRPVKRHDVLIAAFARVARRLPALHLLLAGDGPLLHHTRAVAAAAGLSDRVHFLGFRGDVPVCLRGARALVLASEREGLPRCVLEAMAARVPVIGTEAKGTVDLLSEGCGALVPLNDPGALAQAIVETLTNRLAAESRVRKASQRVRQYDLQRLLAMHEALYAEALETRSVARPGGASSLRD